MVKTKRNKKNKEKITLGNSFSGVIGGKGYALFAEAYPHFYEFEDQIAQRVKEHSKGKSNYHLLEIGCGPGPTTDALLRINPNLKVTAVEIEPQMAKEARQNLAKYGSRVKIVESDISDYLDLVGEGVFEAVASGWTLHNIERNTREKLLQKIYHSLKPEGLFVNGDKYRQSSVTQHAKDYLWSLEGIKRIGKKYIDPEWIQEWFDHMEFDEQPHIVYDEQEAIGLMKEMGYKNPRIIWRKHMEGL